MHLFFFIIIIPSSIVEHFLLVSLVALFLELLQFDLINVNSFGNVIKVLTFFPLFSSL